VRAEQSAGFGDMGMTYWLEKAEAEMRELG
jgi:hypothetical protein